MIILTQYSRKKIAVLGLGRSGLASAKALKAGGAEVLVWDDQKEKREKAKEIGFSAQDFSIGYDWKGTEYLLLSPGIPHEGKKAHPIVILAREQGIPVLGDLELFSRFLETKRLAKEKPKLVVVTGSNGKSTTTALLNHILNTSNRYVQMGGNIGTPVFELKDMGEGGIYIIEASSFQLDLTKTLKPDIAVWLNISPDHIDRHGSLKRYVLAKQKIFYSQDREDSVVIGVDDSFSQKVCTELLSKKDKKIIPVSSRRALASGAHVTGGVLWDAIDGEAKQIADIKGEVPSLPGKHNAQNITAAYTVCRLLKVPQQKIIDAMTKFQNLPHRMEEIGSFSGVRYINDSKATNIAATREALKAFDTIYWIAGGDPKDRNYHELGSELRFVRKIYLIGKASSNMKEVFEGLRPVFEAKTLSHAMALATYHAVKEKKQNPVILLSPACASFDQFKNFEERGDQFKEIFDKIYHTCLAQSPNKNLNRKKGGVKKNNILHEKIGRGTAA